VDTVITDAGIRQEHVALIEGCGVKLIVAKT